MLPCITYIKMDLPIFVIAEWATLLVDIRCPEVVLNLASLSIFKGLAALMSADLAGNLWSLVCSCLNSYCTFFFFSHFWFSKKYVAFSTGFNLLTNIFMLPCITLYYIGSPYVGDSWVGYPVGGYSFSTRWFLTLHSFHFTLLPERMSADIARNLWSLVCSCLNSYRTFFIFSHFWFFFKNMFFSSLDSIC